MLQCLWHSDLKPKLYKFHIHRIVSVYVCSCMLCKKGSGTVIRCSSQATTGSKHHLSPPWLFLASLALQTLEIEETHTGLPCSCMEIHIAENHHGAQQTKWYDASQLWTAHPRGPWRSNHMHHLCRRDFLHQLGLVMRCWNLTRNYAFFHLLYLVNQETAKGKAKAADNRCNCTTENDGFKMNEFTAQELGPNCPGVANHHIYIYISSSLDKQSDTQQSPGRTEIAASKIYGFQSSPTT